MVNFMFDPTGDLPWEEEAGAQDVLHLQTPKVKHIDRNISSFSIENLFRILNEH